MKIEIVKDTPKSQKSGSESLNPRIEQPRWTLKEIALSETVREELDEVLVYLKYRNKLLEEWEFNRFLKSGKGLAINFFGLPGTGKSITAEAIANELKTTMIRVNYGELESSLVGKTSENLSDVFKLSEETGSLLFFDEADTILSKRISNVTQAADHGVNSAKSTLLTLLDKFNGIIIFSTNIFDSYDDAFMRRIVFNIEFLSPDHAMRLQLWQFHLPEPVPKCVDYETLASISEGLCGGDIKNICIKLGLKLLNGSIDSVSQSAVSDLIHNYKEIKTRQKLYKISQDF